MFCLVFYFFFPSSALLDVLCVYVSVFNTRVCSEEWRGGSLAPLQLSFQSNAYYVLSVFSLFCWVDRYTRSLFYAHMYIYRNGTDIERVEISWAPAGIVGCIIIIIPRFGDLYRWPRPTRYIACWSSLSSPICLDQTFLFLFLKIIQKKASECSRLFFYLEMSGMLKRGDEGAGESRSFTTFSTP